MRGSKSRGFAARCAGPWAMVVLLAALAGCANIPKESVELSSELGKGIGETRRAHVAMLNAYFQQKQQALDQFIENEYLPGFVGRVQQGLKAAGRPETLTPPQMADVLKAVMAERDAKHADLEKTRLLVLQKIEDQYASMTQANAGITGLLASAVSVRDATARLNASVKAATQGKIDLDAIDKKVDENLKVVGDAAKKTTSVFDHAKALLGQ